MTESVIVALAVLTALGLYNTVSTRLGVRAVVGSQLDDLSRGNADLARQVAEMGRRLAALEGRMDSVQNRARAATDPLAVEIGELGTLVKQLAETVAAHEARFSELGNRRGRAAGDRRRDRGQRCAEAAAPAVVAGRSPHTRTVPKPPPASTADEEKLAIIRSAIDANRIDLYLQPIVTLPQRKVRYYEAMSRLRTETGDVLQAADFVAAGATRRPDAEDRQPRGVPLRAGGAAAAAQEPRHRPVLQSLAGDRSPTPPCSSSCSTSSTPTARSRRRWCLNSRRARCASAGPIENESLSALADRGFRFSLDNLQDLRIEPRELATRGFRFVKVPGSLLLEPQRGRAPTSIPPIFPICWAASASI